MARPTRLELLRRALSTGFADHKEFADCGPRLGAPGAGVRMGAEWWNLPDDVVPMILVHLLLQFKAPYRHLAREGAHDQNQRCKRVSEMRLLNHAFASVLMPLVLVHSARSKPHYTDRFVEGVLRIHGHAAMEGVAVLGKELACSLNNAFYVTSHVQTFMPITQRHYYSAIAGTLLRLLRDGTIRVPTHEAAVKMASDVEKIFKSLYYRYYVGNCTWCFNAHLPSPGAVIHSLLSPNTLVDSCEEYRNHPTSAIV